MSRAIPCRWPARFLSRVLLGCLLAGLVGGGAVLAQARTGADPALPEAAAGMSAADRTDPGSESVGLPIPTGDDPAADWPMRSVSPPDWLPEPLHPWIPWVLAGEGEDPAGPGRLDCPWQTETRRRLCAWPGALTLELDDRGGRFSQPWRVFAESWIPLPGDADRWPLEVHADAEAAPAVARDGRPAIRLAPGFHEVTGELRWPARPESLTLPAGTGLVRLMLDGQEVPRPRLERGGRLWLGAGGGEQAERDEDRLALTVHRRIDDRLPLRVTTQLELEVSGRARPLRIGPVPLAGGVPLSLDSPLPARLETDGMLEVQVRPGRWTLRVESVHPGAVTELSRAAAPEPWPAREIWAFAARPELRRVTLEGLAAIDPRQTRLPADWARLPVWRADAGQTLRLNEQGRGDPDPGPDRLRLERTLWLDADGAGYSVRDRIQGQLTRGWRLDAAAGLEPGQVVVDGEPRLVTRREGAGGAGVEVRRGELLAVADSRLESPAGWVPASGWAPTFDSVQARLQLPPGWDLLAATGVDNRADTWLARWSLLDLFLVLIVALGVGRLWGPLWGALALTALALTWQAADAPRLVWLHLLAGAALIRLIPPAAPRAALAWIRLAALGYFRLSLLALLLIGLPFLVSQVRLGLYPHLKAPAVAMLGGHWAGMGAQEMPAPAMAPQTSATPLDYAERLPADVERMREGMRSSAPSAKGRQEAGAALDEADALPAAPPPMLGAGDAALPPLETADPAARVQTGPGIPDWQWRGIDLTWSGAVGASDGARLWLLSPAWNLALALLGSLLLVLLGWRIASPDGRLRWRFAAAKGAAATPAATGTTASSAAAALLLLTVLGSLLPAGPARAGDWPDPALLDELKTRLLEPPVCLPDCVELSHLALEAGGGRLVLRLTLDALTEVAVPVPGGTGAWRSDKILVNEMAPVGMARAADERLLLPLPRGRHTAVLSGPLPSQAQVDLPLPLAPRVFESRLDGWRLEGLDEQGRPGGQLQLMRLDGPGADAAETLAQEDLPPLLQVTRLLRLGVDWRVETRVERQSPPAFPVALAVPLLPGESVQTAGARVERDRLLLSLAPGQTQAAWTSRLEPVETLTLTASPDPRLAETWQLDLGPIWHLEAEGLAPIHHLGQAGRWLPQWRPLPGETLTLNVSRPAAVPGPTLTIDRALWRMAPGARGTEHGLTLNLRGTQGGVHRLRLPEGAVPISLTLDERELPLKLDAQGLEFPLTPGAMRVQVVWRDASPLRPFWRPSAPDLGSPAVNLNLSVQLPEDRWTLLTLGPPWGPAVLFWGVLLVLTVLSAGLARGRLTPLRFHDWLLLGIGLSLAEVWITILVVGWLLALGLRHRLAEDTPVWRFNLIQLGLVLLAIAALSGLLGAVRQGLLGMPEMQIQGNGSTGHLLNWYQPAGGPRLPEIGLVSVPLWVYRVLMLAWALWLALRLLQWLRWGWEGFARPVIWREIRLTRPGRTPPG